MQKSYPPHARHGDSFRTGYEHITPCIRAESQPERAVPSLKKTGW